MSTRTSRFALLAAAVLVLGACGGDDDTSLVDRPTEEQTDGAGMRAPTPIRITAGTASGSFDTAGALGAEDAAIEPGIAPWVTEFEYVVGDGLPALPSDDTGYVFDGTAEPTAGEVEQLAAALGVDGDAVRTDDGYTVVWRVGPDDGSAPALWVYDDAQLSWNYNSAYADEPAVACAYETDPVDPAEPVEAPDSGVDASGEEVAPGVVEGSSGGREDGDEPLTRVSTPDCVEPEPPAGVPTEDEARSAAAELLQAMGVDPASLELEVYADEWFASVTATDRTEPRGQIRSWNFGFGAAGALQYASGSLATPEAVGPYPLIDLDAAVARLGDGSFWWGSVGGPAIDIGAPEPGLVEPDDAVSEEDVAADETSVAPDAPVGSEPQEPVVVTVTLVDVRPDLWWAWDVDGAVWLLPAYRFVDTDGGWHVVPAVTDEFLIQADQGDVVDPPSESLPPKETLPPETTVPAESITSANLAEAGRGDEDPAFDEFLGLPLPEFETAVSDQLGFGPVRVAAEDGVWLDVTDDLTDGRVNVAVESGVVVAAVVERCPECVDPGAPEATITGVYDGVAFYPACGDEVLQHESGVWYQIHEFDEPDLYRRAVDNVRENVPEGVGPEGFARGFARVAEPGPGDDVGTLVVWSDDIAYFVSDSGDLTAWLTTTELTYDWVC